MIVFLVSGVWHGASWNFVIWGALHGFFMLFALFFKKIKQNIFYLFNFKKDMFFVKLIRVISTFILVDFDFLFYWQGHVS